jgi:hypothetical protein
MLMGTPRVDKFDHHRCLGSRQVPRLLAELSVERQVRAGHTDTPAAGIVVDRSSHCPIVAR